jgi:hypothetical protein
MTKKGAGIHPQRLLNLAISGSTRHHGILQMAVSLGLGAGGHSADRPPALNQKSLFLAINQQDQRLFRRTWILLSRPYLFQARKAEQTHKFHVLQLLNTTLRLRPAPGHRRGNGHKNQVP